MQLLPGVGGSAGGGALRGARWPQRDVHAFKRRCGERPGPQACRRLATAPKRSPTGGQQEGREVQRGGVDCPTRCGALGPAICPPGAGQRGTLRRRQRGRLTAGGLPPAARAESLLIPAILTTIPVLYNQPCPRHVKQFRSPLLQALLPCLVRPFANQPAVFLFANRLCQPSLCLCLRFMIGYITQTR